MQRELLLKSVLTHGQVLTWGTEGTLRTERCRERCLIRNKSGRRRTC